jgi:titin
LKAILIGTDVTGTVDLGNSSVGVVIGGEASNNLVGGTDPGSRNLISGNDSAGIHIDTVGSTGNLVQGNYIGTDPTGTFSIANVYEGVFIGGGASNNVVGGTAAGAGNLISGNSDNGIVIYGQGASGNTVQGNYIGTDVSGTRALGNIGYGIFIGSAAVDNTVGGLTPGTRNLISGNSEHGIGIFDDGTTGNVVQGNYIGTDASGTLPLGNSRSGIALGDALNNTVGGTAVNAGNIIAFNNESGIVFYNNSENAIFSNSIHSNIGLGIDLGDDGVTANDLTDADAGPNNLQNFPIISSVQRKNKGLEVHGTLLSTPNTSFRLEFFINNTCDPTGYGEGETYLGSAEVKTRITGLTTFKILLPALSTEGKFMTVTATDPTGNTSEFSPCIMVK